MIDDYGEGAAVGYVRRGDVEGGIMVWKSWKGVEGTVMMIKMVMKVDGDGDCVWGDGGNERKRGVGVACFYYREGDGD